jgi:hypothetical protein
MTNSLPTFKGYTVDVRLKQFRKIKQGQKIRFIEFDSPEGDKLLSKYVKTLDRQSAKKVFP